MTRIIAILLLLASACYAEDRTAPNVQVEDRYDIRDENGNLKGYVDQDTLFEDRYNISDDNGNDKGYVDQDALFEDRNNMSDDQDHRQND